jgi:DUF2934 family protein
MSASPQKVRKSKRRSQRVQNKECPSEQAVYSNIEEIVRQRAYYLWELEGKPQGREVEHWHRAQSEIRRELQQT